jgi:hypothetical protein
MYSFELLFVMRGRIATASIAMCVLFVLCSYSSIISINNELERLQMDSTSGQSVHYGDWQEHRRMQYPDGCNSRWSSPIEFLSDTDNSGLLATYSSRCDSEEGEILILSQDDFSIQNTLETTFQLIELSFSPNSEYLAALSFEQFVLFETSTWTVVSVMDYDTYSFYDMTWSGDSNRVVIATGNNGGLMLESPDWNEVTGTTDTGIHVAHHPTENTIWYIRGDGSGSVWEYQSVPLAGEQWVTTRSFQVAATPMEELVVSPDGDMLIQVHYSELRLWPTSSFVNGTVLSGGFAEFSNDESTLLTVDSYGGWMYSSDSWTLETTFQTSFGQIRFASNDSELIQIAEGDFGTELSGLMADSDSDGVVDYKDECPSTQTNEKSNSAGCSPSQRDTDSDGVSDKDDICPRTLIGDTVGLSGCSQAQLTDSDNDGIPDSDDTCPDSDPNSIPDSRGCSSNQRDTDGDGIIDDIDDCPLHDIVACPEVVRWHKEETEVNSTEGYHQFQYSPDGKYITAFDFSSSELVIYDEQFEIQDRIYSGYYAGMYIWDTEWSPTSKQLLIMFNNYSNYNGCEFSFWDVETKELSQSYQILNECSSVYQHSTVYSPDGSMFATSTFSYSSYTHTIYVVNSTTYEILLEDDDWYGIDSLIFTHDGGALIGKGWSSQLIKWDTRDFEFIKSKGVPIWDEFYLTPDSNYVITYSGPWESTGELFMYDTYNFNFSASIEITDSSTKIFDIQFSRSGNLMYVVLVEDFADSSGDKTPILQTYEIDGTNLNLLQSNEIVNLTEGAGDISLEIHPHEEHVLVEFGSMQAIALWQPDSDGDGLIDSIDACPDTALNVEVDENGCGGEQLDDDSDGVRNYMDMCPNSTLGIMSDENGCTDQQVDLDFDGVCDEDAPSNGPSNCSGKDVCPDSANGVQIDENGCSWVQQDSDGDGVNNGDDLCEETEIIGDADANGCDRKQRDTDDDSVNDYDDNCSFTPNEESIDDVGCSDSQVDSDSDSVCDRDAQSIGPSGCEGIDQCPNTGINETVNSNGCSWNQQDDDNDGVFNKFDQCPETKGDSTGADGCTILERDTDNDGVPDTNDECPETQTDAITNQVGCSDSQTQGSLASDGDDSSVTKWALIGGIILVVLLVGGFLLRRDDLGGFGQKTSTEYPEYATRGTMREGQEWIEYPAGSGNSFYRDPSTGQWVKNE